jgi:N-acetylglucosamine kinase-like BadF-type ATPase
MLVLGIDAGGTKTVCQLADEQGGVLAESRGPGANLQVGGELEVEKTLHQVMDGVLAQAAVAPSAVCLGMAGVDPRMPLSCAVCSPASATAPACSWSTTRSSRLKPVRRERPAS